MNSINIYTLWREILKKNPPMPSSKHETLNFSIIKPYIYMPCILYDSKIFHDLECF